jgi:hypothetical protein
MKSSSSSADSWSAIPLFSRKAVKSYERRQAPCRSLNGCAKRLSWTLRLHCLPRPNAVLEHHFDNHEFCGDCVSATDSRRKREKLATFSPKSAYNKELYLVKKHHEQFMEDERSFIMRPTGFEGFNKF